MQDCYVFVDANNLRQNYKRSLKAVFGDEPSGFDLVHIGEVVGQMGLKKLFWYDALPAPKETWACSVLVYTFCRAS